MTLRIINIEEADQRIGLSRRRVDSAAYADMDWKSLVADFNLGASEEGETIGDIVDEEIVESVEEAQETAADETVNVDNTKEVNETKDVDEE